MINYQYLSNFSKQYSLEIRRFYVFMRVSNVDSSFIILKSNVF